MTFSFIHVVAKLQHPICMVKWYSTVYVYITLSLSNHQQLVTLVFQNFGNHEQWCNKCKSADLSFK